MIKVFLLLLGYLYACWMNWYFIGGMRGLIYMHVAIVFSVAIIIAINYDIVKNND